MNFKDVATFCFNTVAPIENSLYEETINAFNEDLHTILTVRNILSRTLFRRSDVQNKFMQLLYTYIDILKCEYSPEQLTYTIKVKKTSVKRMPNYRPEVSFYYNIIGNIMRDLLTQFKDIVVDLFQIHIFGANKNAYIDAYNLYNMIVSDQSRFNLANLANVQCISDNIIQIIM